MKSRGLRMAGFGLIALAAIAGLSAVVMIVWNAIIPDIFGLSTICYWQALGLLALARILFGGLGHGRMHRFAAAHGHMHGGNPIREKWMKMTPEERKKFIMERHAFMGHGRFGGPDFFCGKDFDTEEQPKKDNE